MQTRDIVVKSLKDVAGEVIYCKKKPLQLRAKELQERIKIETREGTLYGEAGDFLLEGIDFEVYPVAKSIFFRTYDILNGEPDLDETDEDDELIEKHREAFEREEKEEVLLAQIYKKDGNISIRHSKSASQFEVFGFLKCYIKLMEKQLVSEFQGTEGWDLF